MRVDDMTFIVVMIGLLLVVVMLMYILLTRRMEEIQHDLEQLKLDSQSNTYGLRSVICAVANLESQTEEDTQNDHG